MSEQNKESARFRIEDKINDVLTGDALNNALDFVAFLHENQLSLDSNDDHVGWAVGGIVGNSIGYVLVNGVAQMPGPWTIWFNSCDFNESDSADDELKETAWAHANFCGHCHAGWKDCGCGDRTIFGRKFDSLCHSPLAFTNPDVQTLKNMKELMLMLK